MEAQCPLCLKQKTIVSSHLIPAAVYDYCKPEPGDRPIAISPKYVISSDRQLQDHLLCRDCEEDLNKGGENWLLPLLARYDGPFPFHEILTRGPIAVVIDRSDKSTGYAAADNPEIRCDDLAHFALGVFWKAAVHSWRGDRTRPLIDLGPYTERVRLFLRREADFPAHMSLTIGVMPPPVKAHLFEYPYRASARQWHNFHFSVPGMRFVLCTGKTIKGDKRLSCFVSNPRHPILVTDMSSFLMDQIARTIGSPENFERFKRLGEKINRRTR
jgi:hypothetical protein